MRRVWIVGGFVLVAAVGVSLSAGHTRAQPAGGDNKDAHRKVTVSGTATVAVKPDTARVSFAVKAHGNDFKTASAECDKKAAAVVKAIEELKIAGLEIKKGPLNFTQYGGGFGMPPLIGPGIPPMPMGGPGVAPPPPPPPPGVPPPAGPAGVDVLAAQPAGGKPAPPANPQPDPAQPKPMAVAPPAAGGVGGAPPPMGVAPPIGGPPMPIGPGGWGGSFEVTRSFTVVATFGKEGGAGKLEDIVAVADKVLAAAVTAGATEAPAFATPAQNPFGGIGVGGQQTSNRVEFYRANLTALRQEAIKLAVADALANAKVAAGAANLTTKDIVTITDQSQFGGPFGIGGGAMNTGRGEVMGEQELTMTLSVTFNY